MKKRILFMDDLPEFLGAYTRCLEDEGYEVMQAETLAKAEQVLQEEHIHLAILDVRMEEERENDISGLLLAQKEKYRAIPKIILTAHPSVEYVRDALRLGPDGAQPAVDFVSKKEAHKTLVGAVKQAFEKHVRINWNLVIQRNDRDPVPFSRLADLISPELAKDLLKSRAEELEELFRRLCYEEEWIQPDRVLWHQEGRVAVAVLTYARGKSDSLVIVCGPGGSISNEVRRYHEFSPKAPGENGTAMVNSCETVHFAGNAYALAGADLQDVCALSQLYQRGPEKTFNLALETLFAKTLAAWHRDKPVAEEEKAPSELYAEYLGLAADSFPRQGFKERVAALIRRAPEIGAKIECRSGELRLDFGGQSYSFPDPIAFFYKSNDDGKPTHLAKAPGSLSGENTLVNMDGRAWLTDFGHAGLAPVHGNFAALEAAIRFDWVEVKNLGWLHKMEEYLIGDEFLKLHVGDVEAPLRKPMRAIEAVRRLMPRPAGRDRLQYNLGIFFQAMRRTADFSPDYRLTSNDLFRILHALMAAAMIAKQVGEGRLGARSRSKPEPRRLRIDEPNQGAWVGGRHVPLTAQSYALLDKLNQHAGKLCSRGELIKVLSARDYDKTDESQDRVLNTAIRRLRKEIEDGTNEPRYILTEPGRGYRLVLEPGRREVRSLPVERPTPGSLGKQMDLARPHRQ